ncbi:unnamed protein product [Prunus armeniaca]
MTKPVRALFEHGATAFDIWEAARKTYTVTQNSSRLFQLRRQSILTCQNGVSVKVFYEILHAIWQEIDCLGPHEYSCADDGARRLKELEVNRVYDFLGGLDPPYDGVCSRILALSPVPPPIEAYAMVMEEDTRQFAMLGGGSMALKVDPAHQRPVTQHDMTGRPSSRKFSPSVGSTRNSLDDPPKCRHCYGNHYSEKCFKEHGYLDWFADYKARTYGPKAACTMTQDETHPLAPYANMCAFDTMPGMGSNTWIIDTGASDHMTYDDNMFDKLSRNSCDPYITSANGLPSLVTGEGTIHLIPSLPLSHVLLNLKTHAKIGHGKRIGGLYYLQLPVAIVRGCVANKVQGGSVKDKQQLWLWHRRLGHPSCDESSFKCETCVMAKSHRTIFPLSNNKVALPFELVHSNVWALPRVTSHGFHWFVTFIDDCTRLTWVYLMKHKHDVASILPEFCAMMSTQFHASVKVFRTDNGGEYVNHTLTQFFLDQGIIHQTTTPFTPQQNGVSECKNHQLLEVARSLMLDMSVLHHLWGHGVLATAYLINRTPSRVLDFKTPLNVLCAHTPPVSVSKLPPKGERRSELKNFGMEDLGRKNVCENLGMENLGCTEAYEGISDGVPTTGRLEDATSRQAICAKPTGRVEGDDRSHGTMRDECMETTGHPEDTTSGPTICAKPTGRPEDNDQLSVEFLNEICPSPEECNSDIGDSCEDEIDIRLPSTLTLFQSTCDDDEIQCLLEMEALNKNATWELIPLPKGKKAVRCRWVFTLKHKADGSIDRYKARLVAKGYTQTYGVDYTETFAPVAKLNTVRVLLSLAANHDWPLLQFDVKNAFLHGDLKEEIYMDPPPGIPVTSKVGMVCKLRKSLYGLKQSPRAWFGRFAACMRKSGVGKAEIQSLQKYLASEFEMKSLGNLKYFLGIEVARSKHETRMLDCKPIDTPSEHNHKLGLYPDHVPTDKERYQRLVGKLIYLAHTRPDIACGRIHNSDWAGLATDRRSTSGYFTFVDGNLVTWRSKKQKVVSRSSAEAEYRGMAHGVCELLWLRRLLRDLGFGPKKPMDLYCDNKAAIAIAHNPVQHDRTKHVEVDRNFIKEKLDAEIVSFPFINSEYELADVLSKAISTSIFHNSLDKLGMRDVFAPT